MNFDFTHFNIKIDINVDYYLKKIAKIKRKVLIEKIILYILIIIDTYFAYDYFMSKYNDLSVLFSIIAIGTIITYMANYFCRHDYVKAYDALGILGMNNQLTFIELLQPMLTQNIDSCMIKVIRNYNESKKNYEAKVFGPKFSNAPEEAKEEPAFIIKYNNEIQYITFIDICVIFNIVDTKGKYIKIIDGIPYWNYEYFEQHKKIYLNVNSTGIYIE